jgi:hypothetical protein
VNLLQTYWENLHCVLKYSVHNVWKVFTKSTFRENNRATCHKITERPVTKSQSDLSQNNPSCLDVRIATIQTVHINRSLLTVFINCHHHKFCTVKIKISFISASIWHMTVWWSYCWIIRTVTWFLFNPFNSELNPIYHLLALLEAHKFSTLAG